MTVVCQCYVFESSVVRCRVLLNAEFGVLCCLAIGQVDL